MRAGQNAVLQMDHGGRIQRPLRLKRLKHLLQLLLRRKKRSRQPLRTKLKHWLLPLLKRLKRLLQ